jgi:hypothetical protein
MNTQQQMVVAVAPKTNPFWPDLDHGSPSLTQLTHSTDLLFNEPMNMKDFLRLWYRGGRRIEGTCKPFEVSMLPSKNESIQHRTSNIQWMCDQTLSSIDNTGDYIEVRRVVSSGDMTPPVFLLSCRIMVTETAMSGPEGCDGFSPMPAIYPNG